MQTDELARKLALYDELVHYGGRSDEAEAMLVQLERDLADEVPRLAARIAALEEELIGYKAANYYDNAVGLHGPRETAYMAYHMNEITAAQFVAAWEAQE